MDGIGCVTGGTIRFDNSKYQLLTAANPNSCLGADTLVSSSLLIVANFQTLLLAVIPNSSGPAAVVW